MTELGPRDIAELFNTSPIDVQKYIVDNALIYEDREVARVVLYAREFGVPVGILTTPSCGELNCLRVDHQVIGE